jgi:hypothetical protein
MPLIGKHNGFLAELKAKLWIYKGEAFQTIPAIYNRTYKEYFLSDIGLL